MDEQKECGTTGNQIHHFHFIKFRPSSKELEKEEAEKRYQFMNLELLRIKQEIDLWKADEHQINQKLMHFAYLDKQIEWKMWEIKNLQRCDLGQVEPCLSVKFVPKTTGFLHLPGKDDRTPIRPDRKRCKKRLIKKGKMDMEYLQQVEEELLSSKKSYGMTSCGTQELNDMIESMVQRIQHGNKKRADEMKIYHEISNFKETKEIYTSPEPHHHSDHYYTREQRSKRDTDRKRSIQHRINIRLDDVEKIKRDQSGRKAGVRRLKADLELARKKISSLRKELEHVNSKRLQAYKCAYELGEQKKELNSSYNELARKGDVVGLKRMCNTQVEGFMRQWNDSKAFREDYEKRKLVTVAGLNT